MPKPILLLALALIACGGPAFTSADGTEGTLTAEGSEASTSTSTSTSTVDSGGTGGATASTTGEAVASASTTGSGGIIRGCWPSPCDTTASASTSTTGQGGATSSDVTSTTESTATVNTVSTMISTATSTTGDVEPEPPTPEEFFPVECEGWNQPDPPQEVCNQGYGGAWPLAAFGTCRLAIWNCTAANCLQIELVETGPDNGERSDLCREFSYLESDGQGNYTPKQPIGCPELDAQIDEVCGG